jgi:hypothetical protein
VGVAVGVAVAVLVDRAVAVAARSVALGFAVAVGDGGVARSAMAVTVRLSAVARSTPIGTRVSRSEATVGAGP